MLTRRVARKATNPDTAGVAERKVHMESERRLQNLRIKDLIRYGIPKAHGGTPLSRQSEVAKVDRIEVNCLVRWTAREIRNGI